MCGLVSGAVAQALPESTPEAEGVSSRGIQRFVEKLESQIDSPHGMVIVRHGKVIARGWWSPYSADQEHIFFSLSKSFTSTAIGMLADEGKLSIHDHVLKFFPEYTPQNPSENLRTMRIRDLLIMGTGQHKEDVDAIDFYHGDGPIAKRFLAMPVPHKPGTLFYYNTPATYMLSAIVQKVSGQTTYDFLKSRLYEPLGFKNPHWDADAQGISFGGFGMYARTDDIATFGQFLLQKGEWKGRRLVSASWIDAATGFQISNGSDPEGDWDQGYGYQFWRCVPGFFRGDGAFGQFCIVMPQYDTVVAFNSGTPDMGGMMKIIWKELLPELRPAPIPADDEGVRLLQAKLSALTLKPLGGEASTPRIAQYSGRTYRFEPNFLNLESLEISERNGVSHVKLVEAGKTVETDIKPGAWTLGEDIPLGPIHSPFAVSGGWSSEDTLTVKVAYTRLTHNAYFTATFSKKSVTIDHHFNVGILGENKPVTLVGVAK